MEVTQITYEFLKNLGNYQNERLAVTVVLHDEEPEIVLQQMRQWVAEELNIRSDVGELKRQKQQLEREIRDLKGELNTIRFQLRRIAQNFGEKNEVRENQDNDDLWSDKASAA